MRECARGEKEEVYHDDETDDVTRSEKTPWTGEGCMVV